MFERFTELARQVVVLAQDESRTLKHNYIGTEHLLLGLLRVDEGVAARVLDGMDVTLAEARAQVTRIVGVGESAAEGQIPFTPRAKKVLELALREAISLGHDYIGTEHILLGLARETEGVGARILVDFDVDARKIRNAVVRAVGGRVPAPPKAVQKILDELETVRAEKEKALDAQEFERAASLRDRERKLSMMAQRLEEEGFGTSLPFRPIVPASAAFGKVPSAASSTLALIVVGWALFGIASGLGLLVGWLIWG